MRDRKGAGDGFAFGKVFVFLVILVGQDAVAIGQPRGEAEHLDFFGGAVAGADIAEIVEHSPLRRVRNSSEREAGGNAFGRAS